MSLLLAVTWGKTMGMLVRRFGALAFFPLGLLDMSVLPTPGGFDALLIVLTATHHELWWYYVVMATFGSLFGAWPTFQLGRKGGEEALEKRLGAKRSKKIFGIYERLGFWSLVVGALAPPPTPAAAFILAAGAFRYPWPKFALSWTLGRLARFGLLAWITMRFGKHLFQWLQGYYRPALWTMAVLGVAGGGYALWMYWQARRARAAESKAAPRSRAA